MEQRVLGQDVTVRLIRDGVVAAEIVAIGTFNETVEQEIKAENFLGRMSEDYSDVFTGYKGDLEFQYARSGWNEFVEALRARAQRANPGIVFNVVRSEVYPNGESVVYVYQDVAWGATSASVASRKDFVKCKMQFACSERTMTRNQL